MKKLWIAVGILAVMTAGAFYSCHYVEKLSGEIIDLLEQAEQAVNAKDWARAETLTGQADRMWEEKSAYLNIIMRHSDTDRVREGLAELRGYLRQREEGEYAAASARLRKAVYTLYEMERLTVANLL